MLNIQTSKIALVILIAFFSLSTSACSQTMPKPKTAQNVVKGYFESYGDKFEETEFGQYKIDEVEVSSVTQLQNGLAWVEAFVSLNDGDIVYKVGVTLEKRTLHWKAISWENLGRAG